MSQLDSQRIYITLMAWRKLYSSLYNKYTYLAIKIRENAVCRSYRSLGLSSHTVLVPVLIPESQV